MKQKTSCFLRVFLVFAVILLSLGDFVCSASAPPDAAADPALLQSAEPTVADTLVVEFNSEQDAQNAQITPLELPVGKKLALASRWDDTNGEHKLMTKTLRENGWRATFFLNQVNQDYANDVVRQMVADGSSIGAHTLNHPSLSLVVPNAIFYQVLGNRVLLESSLDQCVNTFTFPNGLSGNLSDPSCMEKMAETLRRAGILGISEPKHVFDQLNMDKREMVACYLFRADDRNPQLSVFEKEFQRGMELLKAGQLDYCGPFFVLGVHAWQRQSGPDGFDRLSKIIATESNNPEYWYCNTNEYTAYRLSTLNSRFEKQAFSANQTKTAAAGAQVQFQIERPNPAVLGAAVDLGLKITPVPKSARWVRGAETESRSESSPAGETNAESGQVLPINSNGELMLPASGQTPAKIGLANASNGFVCSKFPKIRLETKVDIQKNVLICSLKNDSDALIGQPAFAFRVPLKWNRGIYTISLKSACGKESLKPGEQSQWTVPLSEFSADSRFDDFQMYFVTQMDFCYVSDAKPVQARLYSETVVAQPPQDLPVPRDTAWFIGSVPGADITSGWLEKCSQPNASLISMGDTRVQTWRKVSNNKQNIQTALESVQADGNAKQPAIVYCFEFKANEQTAAPCTLKAGPNRQYREAWLNGKRLTTSDDGKFTAQPGVNRLLVVFEDSWTYYIRKAEVLVQTQDGTPVKCLTIDPNAKAAEPASTNQSANAALSIPVDDNLVVLVSDVHIHQELVQGGQKKMFDTRADFNKCVANVLKMNPRPTAVVFFGDLQHIGLSDEPYQMFKEALKPWDDAKIPYYLCMGNHDQPGRFFKVFPEWLPKTKVEKALVYDIRLSALDLIILETTDYSNGWYGKLGEKQKAWYEQRIAEQKPVRPVFICGHHDWGLMREKPDMSNPNIQGWICGHRHNFVTNSFPDGVRELRIPASGHSDVGYNGYVILNILPDKYVFTLKTYDEDNPENGRTITLEKK